MTISERERIYSRIDNAIMKNYDEVTDHEEPYISLSLYEYELPFPRAYQPESETEFVDELFASVSDLKAHFGVTLCISNEKEDSCDRVYEIDIYDLDDEYLTKLVEIAEAHQGMHYGKENLDRVGATLA